MKRVWAIFSEPRRVSDPIRAFSAQYFRSAAEDETTEKPILARWYASPVYQTVVSLWSLGMASSDFGEKNTVSFGAHCQASSRKKEPHGSDHPGRDLSFTGGGLLKCARNFANPDDVCYEGVLYAYWYICTYKFVDVTEQYTELCGNLQTCCLRSDARF